MSEKYSSFISLMFFFLIMKSVPLEDLPIKTRLMLHSCKKAQ